MNDTPNLTVFLLQRFVDQAANMEHVLCQMSVNVSEATSVLSVKNVSVLCFFLYCSCIQVQREITAFLFVCFIVKFRTQ